MLNSDFFKSQKSDRKVKIQRAKKSKSLKSVPSWIAYMLPDPGRQQKTDWDVLFHSLWVGRFTWYLKKKKKVRF